MITVFIRAMATAAPKAGAKTIRKIAPFGCWSMVSTSPDMAVMAVAVKRTAKILLKGMVGSCTNVCP
jgi:hypothetical protein